MVVLGNREQERVKLRREGFLIGAILAKKGIADGFEAMNRRDLAAVMANWHEDAVFAYPGELPASGTFKGKSVIEAWYRRYYE